MQRNLNADLAKAELLTRLVGSAPRAVRLGRFELRRLLGQGGMGSVYAAFDTERQQCVALKTLDAADADSLLRFKREFRTLVELAHPNLVELYELLNDDDRWYFTMEHVEGVQFLHHLRPACGLAQRFDDARLRNTLRQVVVAVQHIHAAGILHRDLKPQNVLVTAQERAMVLDFGLVTDAFRTARSVRITDGALLGTAAYVAPERVRGADACPASDFYALGVMLFEALTGRLPFAGNAWQLLTAKLEYAAPDAGSWAPDAPNDLIGLAARLLSRDPAARPAGDEVLSVLERGCAAPRSAQAASVAPPAAIFVGRAVELTALRVAYEASSAGQPTLALIGGEPGIGKTALLQRFTERLPSEALVLSGRCHELEAVPYKAFDGVADMLFQHMSQLDAVALSRLTPRHVDALTQIFPVFGHVRDFASVNVEHRGNRSPHAQELAFVAFKDLLHRLCEIRPLVLSVDDLHWADADSERLLNYLFGDPDPIPALFVATYRTRDTGAFGSWRWLLDADAAPLARQVNVNRVAVGPVNEAECLELATALIRTHELDASLAGTLAREAAGVPHFLVELVHHERARR